MKHNHIFHFLGAALAVVTVNSACTFEQDDLFDESAAQRVMTTNATLKSKLVEQSSSDKYGWVIQYYVPGTEDVRGEGYNLFARFTDNEKVLMGGNHRYLRNGNAGKYTEYSSIYDVISEEGTVLSFCSWNDILTVFSDPVDPTQAPNTIISDGVGLNGDYNLVLQSLGDNEILFRGERHRAEANFVKCDRPWADYLAAADSIKNMISSKSLNSYYLTDGKDTMYYSNLFSGKPDRVDRLIDPLKTVPLSVVFTPNGFRMNQIDSLGNHAFHQFTLAADNSHLVSDDSDVRLIPCWDNYITKYSGVWNFDNSQLTSEQSTLYSQIESELKKFKSDYSLANIGIGLTTGTQRGLVITFYTTAAKSKTNNVVYYLTMNRTAYGQVSLQPTDPESTDKNMTTISKKATNLPDYCRQFAATVTGEYTVVPDNYFLPTGGTFTSIDGTKTFILKK